MKRIFLLFSFTLFVMSAFCQNAQMVKAAENAFAQGNYNDAVEIYAGVVQAEKSEVTKQQYQKRLSLARLCLSKQRQANAAFADKRYQAAKALYNELLRNNPKDEAAKRRLNQCETNISNVNLQKKLNKELDDILINNNKSALQSFVSNNKGCADYELLKSLLSYYDNPNILKSDSLPLRIQKLMSYGDLYVEKNKKVAAEFYEKAAELGCLPAFYKLAQQLPYDSSDRQKKLLIFASSNGLDDATQLYNKTYGNNTINPDNSVLLYKHLKNANNGDVLSMVVIQKNRESIGLPKLYLIDDDIDYAEDEINDSWQYSLGMMYLYGDQVNKNINKAIDYFVYASFLGNHDAQYQVGMLFKKKDDVYCVAWLLCSALNGNDKARQELRMSMSDIKYASEYVKFLNNKKYNSDYVIEFFKKFSSIYRNKDNYLIVLASNPQIDSKSYKTFSALLKTQTNWEKQTLQTINKNIGKSDNKYHKRIIKQIRKVNAVTSKKQEDYFVDFVNDGFLDNGHGGLLIDEIDLFPKSKNNVNYTSSSLAEPVFTERKQSSQSGSSGYYVGQDIGVGYVIYVDNTGKHGLIASKKYAQVSAVYQFGWIGGGGSYNWRACTGSELKTIYNVVGSKYPKQWFLSSDKNPNSVLKNKPDRFGVNFRNGQAMYITGTNTGPYYTIAVAEF